MYNLSILCILQIYVYQHVRLTTFMPYLNQIDSRPLSMDSYPIQHYYIPYLSLFFENINNHRNYNHNFSAHDLP